MAGMDKFTIGDTVQITGSTMTGSVGTVVETRIGAASGGLASAIEVEQ
ncbi:hypothetical protein [Brachybacterium sp. FME24]|nr:hypothetical protein [Brachybacterium sp. FME24]